MQVDEVDEDVVRVVGCNADDVSVLAFEGGAGEDDALITRRESADSLFAELSEPVPAVGVGERNALSHLVDVGFGVVLQGVSVCVNKAIGMVNYLIALYVGKIHGLSNKLSDGTLATSCRAGDQPNVVVMVGLGLTCAIRRAIRHIRG